jgi:uncharacterized SAM-binding protein YcdF (DUF218 family)
LYKKWHTTNSLIELSFEFLGVIFSTTHTQVKVRALARGPEVVPTTLILRLFVPHATSVCAGSESVDSPTCCSWGDVVMGGHYTCCELLICDLLTMLSLMRDWLLDPAALLFLCSLVVGIWLVHRVRRVKRSVEFVKGAGEIAGVASGKQDGRVTTMVLVVAWFAVYAVFTAPAVVNPLIVFIEQSDIPDSDCETGSHVIVLGGGVDSRARTAAEYYRMRPATFVRATNAASIALEEPTIKLLVAGGAIGSVAEADVIAHYLVALGVAEERLVLDRYSSNTRENALNALSLLSEETVEGPVRLVTSALHMKRAIKTFSKAFQGSGFTVCPIRVDFQGFTDPAAYALMPQTTSLVKFDLWIHEVIALAVYRLRGWI